MSLLDELVESDFVKISRSPDFDHFRRIEGLGEANSIPLGVRDFAASFASLRLRNCTVYLQRTFPRILQVQYSTAGAIVGLLMDDASLTVNGMEARPPALLLVKGTAKCEIVEQQANLAAFVHFDSIDDRGWPGEVDCAQVVNTEHARHDALRATVRDALMLASHSPETLTQPNVIESIEESMLQAVDLAMAAASPAPDGKRLSLNHYLALVRIRRIRRRQRRQDDVQRRRSAAAWSLGADAA